MTGIVITIQITLKTLRQSLKTLLAVYVDADLCGPLHTNTGSDKRCVLLYFMLWPERVQKSEFYVISVLEIFQLSYSICLPRNLYVRVKRMCVFVVTKLNVFHQYHVPCDIDKSFVNHSHTYVLTYFFLTKNKSMSTKLERKCKGELHVI